MANPNKQMHKKQIEKIKVHHSIKLFFDRTKAIYDNEELHEELLLFISSINKIANPKNNTSNALEEGFIYYLNKINQPKKRSVKAILGKIKTPTQNPSFKELLPLWSDLKSKGYSLRKIELYTLNNLGVKVSKTTIGNYLKEEEI